jgi:hypothetical protein
VVSSTACQPRGCAEDHPHHPLWPLQLYENAFWSQEHRSVLTVAHDGAIRGCEAAFAWVDDIIIHIKTHKEHISNMRQVLQALQWSGLVINGKASQSWTTCGPSHFGRRHAAAFLPHGGCYPGVYPLPNMLDFATKAASCTVFSKIDQHQWHRQQPVNPEDVH